MGASFDDCGTTACFFNDEEAYDHQPWMDALSESAPVFLRRPLVLAPSNVFFIFSDPRLLIMNRVETPRMTRGPPAKAAA
jgi:hypothetical protein